MTAFTGEPVDRLDPASLVREDRVHGDVYTSEAVFELELERIFHRWWIYVAHESEIAHAGDYVLKWMGQQSVIVSRSEDGDVHVLANRCSHRGSTVCQYEKGNSSYFRCQYHGWTFQNDGTLTGVPYPSRYGDTFLKADHGLSKVPRVGVYRGFIFASLAEDGMSFSEYISPARAGIDAFVAASPSGQIALSAGVHKSEFLGNWKFVGQDGYHPAFTHRSMRDIRTNRLRLEGKERGTKGGELFSDKSPDLAIDLGNGHAQLDRTATRRDKIEKQIASLEKTVDGSAYLESLAEAYGASSVTDVLTHADPHMTVWPNLMVTNTQIRVTRPLAAGRSETFVYPVMLKDVPDSVNEDRLRAHEGFHGPAGFGTPDDYEIFERNQIGLQFDAAPWVLLARGLTGESIRDDGARVGNITDETTQRGQLREWRRVMSLA